MKEVLYSCQSRDRASSHFRILAVSIHNLKYPFHGSARLQLSMLGALSLTGSRIVYLNVASNASSMEEVPVISRYGVASFKQANLSGTISQNQIKYLRVMPAVKDILNYTDPNIILCFSRQTFLLCKMLSLKLNIPLVTLHDAMRYLYVNQLIRASLLGAKEVPSALLALPFYVATTLASNASIAVSENIKSSFGSLINRRIHVVRPTFMLLNDAHDTPSEKLSKLDELPEELVLYSGPLGTLRYIASKTPNINYVITGPSAYYAKLSGLNNFSNIYLVHNISDQLLSKLHDKIALAIIIRNVMTGISMTAIQELYFGKPLLTNAVALQGLEELKHQGIANVSDDVLKLTSCLGEVLKNKRLREELEHKSLNFFDKHLSPFIFAKNMYSVLRELLARQA